MTPDFLNPTGQLPRITRRLWPIVLALLLACIPANAQEQPPAAATPATPAAAAAEVSPQTPAKTGAFEALVSRIRSAGIVGFLILVMSVISLAVALAQFSQLRRGRICPDGLVPPVRKALEEGDLKAASERARASESVLGRILLSVVTHLSFDFAEVSTIAGDVAARELKRHMQRSYPMLIVATSATLLGLLGTVIGMIRSFEAVAMAGELGDPSIMAADISYALVTTAMGLIVALPSLILYHYFRNRIQAYGTELDELVSDFISGYFQEKKRAALSVGSPTGA